MMKKTIMAAALAATACAFGEMKIGTVEMMTLVRNHPSYEINKSTLADAEKDYQKKLERMRADLEEIQEEGRKLTEQLKNPMLAAGAKSKLEKDMLDVQNKFLSGQQKMRSEAMRSQQELETLESRMLKATTDDLRKKVSAYATKNGYDLVIESTAAIFSKKEFDVTNEILKSMGIDPAAVKSDDEKGETLVKPEDVTAPIEVKSEAANEGK